MKNTFRLVSEFYGTFGTKYFLEIETICNTSVIEISETVFNRLKNEQEVEDKIRQTHANMANREQPLKEQAGELFTSGDWEINMGQIRAPKEFTTTFGEKANGWANICAMSYDVTMSKEEAEANARIICEAPAMYHALKVLAELDLTGVTGEIVYQRNKSKILVKDVLKAKAILSRINNK